jgi:HSP20 family protein
MNERSTVERQDRSDRGNPPMLPAVDVFEDPNAITLYADLPGVPKDRLAVHIERDTLTIEGDIVLEIKEGMEASHVEVDRPSYRRVFSLSKELDTDKVSAELAHGVLKLRIPKVAQAQPRRIDVQVM